MKQEDAERLAAYYDEHDLADEMEGGTWSDEPVLSPRPMIATSIRMPEHVMNAIREVAEQRGTKPRELMREWVEAGLADHLADGTVPASLLRAAIADHLTRQRRTA